MSAFLDPDPVISAGPTLDDIKHALFCPNGNYDNRCPRASPPWGYHVLHFVVNGVDVPMIVTDVISVYHSTLIDGKGGLATTSSGCTLRLVDAAAIGNASGPFSTSVEEVNDWKRTLHTVNVTSYKDGTCFFSGWDLFKDPCPTCMGDGFTD